MIVPTYSQLSIDEMQAFINGMAYAGFTDIMELANTSEATLRKYRKWNHEVAFAHAHVQGLLQVVAPGSEDPRQQQASGTPRKPFSFNFSVGSVADGVGSLVYGVARFAWGLVVGFFTPPQAYKDAHPGFYKRG